MSIPPNTPAPDETAPHQTAPARFPALASWDFRRIFANSFFSTGSRWAQVLARGWLVHDLSDGSSGAVGWITFAAFIPFVLIGPFAGAIADRFDRRRLLIAATIFGMLGAATLAAITLAGLVQVWHVGVLALLTGSAQATAVPARQSLIANVVPERDLLNAIALAGISKHGSRVVGPLFGAAFLNTLGAGSVFVFSTALMGLGLVEAIRVRHRSPATDVAPGDMAAAGDTARRLVGDLRSAARYVRADRRLLTVILLVGGHCSLTMAFDSMMPTLSEKVGGGSTLYSGILVGLGLGAIIGTLGVSQLRRDLFRGRAFVATGFGSGFAMVILGVATEPSIVLVGAVLAGLTQASYMTLSATLIQTTVTDHYRGRVMSLYIMIAAGHMAILNLGYGRTAESVDVRLLLVGPGILWVALFALAIVSMREARSIAVSGKFTPSLVSSDS